MGRGSSSFFVFIVGFVLLRVNGSSAFCPPLNRISSRMASSALSTLRLRLRSLMYEIEDKVEERKLLSLSALSSSSASSFVILSVSSSSPLSSYETKNE